MTAEERLKIEKNIVRVLKNIFDPEIPVNIYDLGLIYKIDLKDTGDLEIDMTLTAPNCPMADVLFADVKEQTSYVPGVTSVHVNLVFEPAWEKSMITEEGLLELGML